MISNNAKWIWLNAENQRNQYVEFVTDVDIDDLSQRYTLSLSVAGNYCVFVNGKFAGCARFDDYPEYKMYDELDITNLLIKGTNRLFFLCFAMYAWSGRSVQMESGFIAELSDRQGKTFFCTDTNVLSRLSPLYKSGSDVPTVGNGNAFSADVNLTDYNETGFCPSRLSAGTYTLVKRPCKLTVNRDILPTELISQGVFKVDNYAKRNEKLQKAWLSHRYPNELTLQNVKYKFPSQSVEFSAKGENIFLLFDLQAEQNGYVSFDFELNCDADVEIAFGEHLDDLRVRTSIDGRNFTSVFHAHKGRNKFTDYMNRLGFRYLQVYFYTDYVKLNYFGMLYNEYPVTVYDFDTDNALRKKIYQTCVKTLHECMHEHYEDCPWREQSLYAMDSRNQMLCGYYAFREYEFPRANLELLFKRRRPNNQLLLTPPTDNWTNIPCFTLVSFLSLKEYSVYSNDLSLATEVEPVLKEIISTFISQLDKERNLLQRYPSNDECIWNFYEWTEGMWNNWGDHPLREGSVEYPSVLNAFLVVALDNYAEILSMLGKDGSYYKTVANTVRNAVTSTFWSDEKQCFSAYETDGKLEYFNELANAMVLYCGAGSDSQRSVVANKLMSNNSGLTPCTLSMTMFKYQALIDIDRNNVNYVLDDIDLKWGYMLYRNSTTFWETIVGGDDFEFAGSLCHGWSAIPAYFYMKYVQK